MKWYAIPLIYRVNKAIDVIATVAPKMCVIDNALAIKVGGNI